MATVVLVSHYGKNKTDWGQGEQKSKGNRISINGGKMRILVGKSKGGGQEEIIQGKGGGRMLIV